MPKDLYIDGKKLSEFTEAEKIDLLCTLIRGKIPSKIQEKTSDGVNPPIFIDVGEVFLVNDLITSTFYDRTGNRVTDAQIVDLFNQALSSIPEDQVSIQEKHKFIKTYVHWLVSKIELHYVEFLPNLGLQKRVTVITLPEYEQAAQNANYSDYIVLTVGLLRQFSVDDDALLKKIQEIEMEYFELNYSKCLQLIDEIANKKLKTGDALARRASESILKAKESSMTVDPDKNDTRRWFGTRLSQYMMNDANQEKVIDSIHRISQFILRKPVETIAQLEEVIPLIAESERNHVYWRKKGLEDLSAKFNARFIMTKSGFSRRRWELEGNFSEESIFSMNLGSLRSNSPNFRDELTRSALRNRLTDIVRPEQGDYTFLYNRENADSIVSISGHAFFIVALLENYIVNNKEKYKREYASKATSTLEDDINHFIMAFVATYAKRGLHNMHEVLDVLREPHVMQVFADQGVKVKFLLNPRTLSKAMNDTLAYSKSCCLKATMHEDLNQKFSIRKLVAMDSEGLKQALSDYASMINGLNHENTNSLQIARKVERTLKAVAKIRPEFKYQIAKILGSINDFYFTKKVELAFRSKNEEQIRALFDDPLITRNINKKTHMQNSIFALAIRGGYDQLIPKLIELGADKEIRDSNGRTPLMLAVQANNLNFVSRLLEAGCDPNSKDSDNITPLIACFNRNNFEMVQLLIQKGADPWILNEGMSLLSRASYYGDNNIVQLCLEQIKQKDSTFIKKELQLALLEAISGRNVDTIELLLGAGADLNMPAIEGGMPPIIAATTHQSQEYIILPVVKLLVEKGANLNVQYQGKDVIEYAREANREGNKENLVKEIEKGLLNKRESKEPEAAPSALTFAFHGKMTPDQKESEVDKNRHKP